ncbi:F0F1 ATP synthase subunit A [Candidatus Nomurabacteria bacterium]|nr:F0F1 ATP synthase subunit A [Candidatus Nomurabacteria bacterium]
MILGVIGSLMAVALLFYVANKLKNSKRNFLVGLVQWTFEGFLKQAEEVIGDKATARRIFPLAITMFFVILVTYWLSVLPGVGSISVDGTPLLRALPADLNFTFALAIITLITTQVYAVRKHGAFGNIGRYFKNPFKDPVSAFEGLLEFVGEFSRTIALSFRLFGNAFAGEVLLILIAMLAGYFSTVVLPFFMIFELFIGFIQAYVFFVLTIIFTALALITHGDHDKEHSPAVKPMSVGQE